MKKQYIIAKLDEVINSGNLIEGDKNTLIQVKKEIERSTNLKEALSTLASCLVKVLGNNLDLFQ